MMARAKKGLCLLLAGLLCLALAGCGYHELYERLLIHGIGVDAGPEGFIVTVRSSISPQDEGEEYFRCEGRSVLEALSSLSLSTGREPFYSHNYLVVFGKGCAQQGLDQCLDFFVRYYNTRPAVQMYMAENTAEEILSYEKDGKLLKMSQLQQLADSGKNNGKAVGAEVLDFVNGVKREGSSPVLPVLRAGKEGVEVCATAYFDGYRLKGALTLEQTRGYMAAKNLLEKGDAVVTGGFGAATLSISQAEGDIAVHLEGGVPVFTISIQARANVSAISGGRGQPSESDCRQMGQAAAQALQEEVLSALGQAVQEDRCDIFGFGNLLYQQFPNYWRGVADDWPGLLPGCKFLSTASVEVESMARG